MTAAAPVADSPAFEIAGLSVAARGHRGETALVRGVDLTVAAGERVALVGESGSGKSMTALAAMGLLPRGIRRTGGEIRLAGRAIQDLDDRALRRLRGDAIAMIFQDPMTSLNPVQTIGRQLVEAIRLHRPVGRDAARARAAELLDRVHIPRAAARLDDYPHEFSGGMRQRVMIAMALANDPGVLIADEPTTALDVTTQARVMAILDEVCAEAGVAVLLITHDLGVVGAFCDRVAVMYAGEIVERAPAATLFERPRHPYTAGLLASMPPLEADPDALTPIPGDPPDPRALPPGCVFAPRCGLADARCRAERPALIDRDDEGGAGQVSACHHADRVDRPEVFA
ncbi:MAG: ABC transporter ATP-binding protein [Azospirillaceae bacterium]